jgi:hypothetical protein
VFAYFIQCSIRFAHSEERASKASKGRSQFLLSHSAKDGTAHARATHVAEQYQPGGALVRSTPYMPYVPYIPYMP